MTFNSDSSQSQTIQDEIADLEKRLQDAKARLTINLRPNAPKLPVANEGM